MAASSNFSLLYFTLFFCYSKWMERDDHDFRHEDALLTTQEVARRLRVTPETVRRLGRSGRLPGFALSDKSGWRFRRADVDAFIRAAMRRDR
jgi:excisionase family DNA binding protein